jgi:uncharacterized protein YbaP (TraB family)
MRRREFGFAVLTLLLARHGISAAGASQGTPLQLFTRRHARVYVLGFGEARDESWATPELRKAFQSSEDLWLEVSHAPGTEPDAAAKREQLTRDPAGRTFFEVLEPAVRARAQNYCAELGIPADKIEHQRPWSAFYTINGAYWSRHKLSFEPRNPDETLFKWAEEQHKPVRYETPSQLDFARFMAAMPDAAQSQYITFLLDFLDDQTAGLNTGEFEWIHGDTSAGERAVARMRTRTPDLYRIMQVQRNGWWARKIDELLDAGGTHFVAIGQMHVLGPDGIPAQLRSSMYRISGFTRDRSC